MPSAPSGHYGGDRGYNTGGGFGSGGLNGMLWPRWYDLSEIILTYAKQTVATPSANNYLCLRNHHTQSTLETCHSMQHKAISWTSLGAAKSPVSESWKTKWK